MSVAETSRAAYEKIKPRLGHRHAQVYEAIGSLGIASNEQISEHLSLPINQITGRVKELRDRGLVGYERHITARSGNSVMAWSVRDPNDKKLAEVANEPEYEDVR